jgi:transcriptional regulator with XRE-family HTH domain
MPGRARTLAAETIGGRLRRLRLERGLSQRELAAPGVSYAYISRIEAGTRQPSVKALRRLAANLGVSPEYLETGSDLAPAAERELELAELELAVRLGEPGDARRRLEELLADALAGGDREAALRARTTLALLAEESGDPRAAVDVLEQALTEGSISPADHAAAYSSLGRAYAATGRADAATELLERALAGAREHGSTPWHEARYAAALGRVLADSGDQARAEAVVREAVPADAEPPDSLTRARAYRSLASSAQRAGDSGTALANARRALALLDAADDATELARAYGLASSLALAGGDADAAARHLDAAERVLAGLHSTPEAAMLPVRRSQLAAARGDGTAAVELARTALAAIGEERPEDRGAALLALADGLSMTGSGPEAGDAYGRAVDLLEESGRWREATQGCRSWARMLRSAGREAEALDVLDRAAGLGLRSSPGDTLREL